jgi:hypothetical protein
VDANVELVPLVDERVTAASGLKWVPLLKLNHCDSIANKNF